LRSLWIAQGFVDTQDPRCAQMAGDCSHHGRLGGHRRAVCTKAKIDTVSACTS